jgi:transposase
MTYTEFMRLFPDNTACLDYLKDKFFPDGTHCPKCERPSRFRKINGRSAYSCQFCGHHIYPTANTIFHKSTTSMQMWFWAIFLMASTRCGISAKQLEREIGVSNKTALRMFRQIRSLLGEDESDTPLEGKIEADETGYGGKLRASQTRGKTRQEVKRMSDAKKITVFGMVERQGRVRAMVVPDRKKPTLTGKLREHVLPGSMIFTDEFRLYSGLKEGYTHKRIKHKARIYVDGDISTNTIEGFFGLVKNGIRGVYHSVSEKHLQSYLDEYSFRYNARDSERPMFWLILDRVRKDRLAVAG